jgi:hypothetical protein
MAEPQQEYELKMRVKFPSEMRPLGIEKYIREHIFTEGWYGQFNTTYIIVDLFQFRPLTRAPPDQECRTCKHDGMRTCPHHGYPESAILRPCKGKAPETEDALTAAAYLKGKADGKAENAIPDLRRIEDLCNEAIKKHDDPRAVLNAIAKHDIQVTHAATLAVLDLIIKAFEKEDEDGFANMTRAKKIVETLRIQEDKK